MILLYVVWKGDFVVCSGEISVQGREGEGGERGVFCREKMTV